VRNDLERQTIHEGQDPPGSTRRVVAAERPVGNAGTNRALQDGRPSEVESARRLPEHRPAGGLGPRVKPQLECPVVADRGVGGEEGLNDRAGIVGLVEEHLGLLEVLACDTLEGHRQDLVHRVEVVVDQAARGAHLGGDVADGRGGETLPARERQRGIDDRVAAVLGRHSGHCAHSS